MNLLRVRSKRKSGNEQPPNPPSRKVTWAAQQPHLGNSFSRVYVYSRTLWFLRAIVELLNRLQVDKTTQNLGLLLRGIGGGSTEPSPSSFLFGGGGGGAFFPRPPVCAGPGDALDDAKLFILPVIPYF